MRSFVILLLVTAGLAINTNDQKKDKQSLLVSKLGTSSYLNLSTNGLSRYPPDLDIKVSEKDESPANTLVSAYPSRLKYKGFYKGNFDNISLRKLATLDQPAGLVSGVLPTLTHGKTKRFARGRPSDTLDRNVQVPSTSLIPPIYVAPPFATPTSTPQTQPSTPFIKTIPKISGSILDNVNV